MSAPPYTIVSHPVLLHKLTLLRMASTQSADVRRLVKDISSILAIEASRDLALSVLPGVSYSSHTLDPEGLTEERQLTSPVAPFDGQQLAHRIGISPILRAGIGMTSAVLHLFPAASVFYLFVHPPPLPSSSTNDGWTVDCSGRKSRWLL
jgi:uracil phosphoribosyltransferase